MAACWSRANIRQRLPGKPRAHTAGGVKSLTLGGQDLWNRERPCGTYASAGGATISAQLRPSGRHVHVTTIKVLESTLGLLPG